jgi:Domain of unknown function (DUF4173)
MPKKRWPFWLAALLAGWAVDFLFWGHAAGVSRTIWVAVILLAGIGAAWSEGIKPAGKNWILVIAALAMASVATIRSEPMTVAVAFALSIAAVFVLAFSYRQGNWVYYRLRDYLLSGLRLLGAMIVHPVKFTSASGADPAVGEGPSPKKTHYVAPVLRGILIAIPIVGVLAALLASADPIFSNELAALFTWFTLPNWPEYLFRLIYILIFVYVILGSYWHAIYPKHADERLDQQPDSFKPFLGWTESGVVLLLVNILFAAFVVVQFRYFFGGQANITAEGYTYSDYAVRGFNELVSVAVISLLLLLALGAVTQRTNRFQSRSFSVLAVILVVLVLVILVSSFQRLTLYEDAYGFTRLRTYTHVFIPWLGALLVATAVLEVLRQSQRFALCLAVLAFGFGITLAALNVDAFITTQNIQRAEARYELNPASQRVQDLDADYLGGLSTDSTPVLAAAFTSSKLSLTEKDEIGGILACWSYRLENNTDQSWQSFTFSKSSAMAILQSMQGQLAGYHAKDQNGSYVTFKGTDYPCEDLSWMGD